MEYAFLDVEKKTRQLICSSFLELLYLLIFVYFDIHSESKEVQKLGQFSRFLSNSENIGI